MILRDVNVLVYAFKGGLIEHERFRSCWSALSRARARRALPATVAVEPGERHWKVFTDLVASTGCRGGRVADAYFAALAIE